MTEARIHDRGYLAYDGRPPRHSGRAMVVPGLPHRAASTRSQAVQLAKGSCPLITLLIAFVPAIVFIGLAALLPASSDLELGLDPTADYYWLHYRVDGVLVHLLRNP